MNDYLALRLESSRTIELILPMSNEIPRFDAVPDIRLIACDMDGTLLDNADRIHDDFWPLIETLHARGILFCPASGRQYYSLLERFSAIADELVFIAENGTYVVHRGEELFSEPLDRTEARNLVEIGRHLKQREPGVNMVLCGKHSAYIETDAPDFHAEVAKYYHRLKMVPDLQRVEDDILKLAVFAHNASERLTLPAFAHCVHTHQVAVSGAHWLDLMVPQANKGSGIRHIQEKFSISREQTMAFGDFLNDLEMMNEAAYSFAMANAHPKLKAAARFQAPGNDDNGVVRTIRSVLGLI